MSLTSDDILSFSDGEVREIIVPQWEDKPKGGVLYIRSFDYGQMTRFKRMCNEVTFAKVIGLGLGDTTVEDVEITLLINSLCDPSGNLLFSDNPEDRKKLNSIRGQEEAFEFIVDEIDKLNNLRPKHDSNVSQDELKDLLQEEIKKK